MDIELKSQNAHSENSSNNSQSHHKNLHIIPKIVHINVDEIEMIDAEKAATPKSAAVENNQLLSQNFNSFDFDDEETSDDETNKFLHHLNVDFDVLKRERSLSELTELSETLVRRASNLSEISKIVLDKENQKTVKLKYWWKKLIKQMLPIEFYQKLDSKYRKLIYSLDKELENSKTHIHYHEILKSFAELYMIPWQYWKSAHISNYYGDKHYLTLFSLYQFYYSFKKLQFMFYRRSQNSNRRCFKHSSQYLDTNVNLLIHDLQVPHCDLKEIWKLYEQNICSFPPKNIVNIYHKMRDLYDKIISVEKDEEKWMKALMESKNNEFVLQNVECRLGGDLNNKKLWKLYFEFLKQNDIEKMLQTYSKYCRFFLSDVEMLDEYQAAVEEHGTITQADIDWWSYFKSFFVKSQKLVPVPWKNTFNFEMYDEIKIRSLNHELPDFEEIKSSPSPLELFFTSDNAVSHNFYFRASFINYIQQNASAEVQQKLKMSCKYFHINFPVTIIYKLIVSNEWQKNFIKCNEQSIKVSNYEIHKIYVDKIYLTTKLEFSSPSSGTNALSNFLRKIVKCSVKYLSIYGQNLSFNEFNLLVGHGEVLELCLLSVKIYKAKNEMLAFEDMLKMLPKIEDLIVSNFWTSKETNTELLKISFKNKFKTLSLKLDKNFHIDAAEIFKFLKKNACSTCKIYINLKMHRSLLDSFQKTIDENINAFWRGKEKPYFEALRYKDDCKTFNL